MASPLADPVRSALALRRTEINAQVAALSRSYPGLTGEEVQRWVMDFVSPLLEAVHARQANATVGVLDALMELGLPLVAQGWLGPRSRNGEFATGLQHLALRLPQHLAAEPRRVFAALINGLHNLAATPGARLHEWIALMHRLGESASDTSTLLALGQVAAWHCGMAHYRKGALDLLPVLPPDLAALASGAPAPLTREDIARLAAHPWLAPSRLREAPAPAMLRLVARAGGFAGFGGPFRTPPLVIRQAGQLLARSGEQYHLICADACGISLHNRGATNGPNETCEGRVKPDGTVHFRGQTASLPIPLDGTSAADDGQTLVATSATSHMLFLFAVV